jgi:hypothetical protein
MSVDHRQGDGLLPAVDDVPAHARPVRRDGGAIGWTFGLPPGAYAPDLMS